ncbi:YggT family protein [Frankia sp. AiPa1]|uniref:YggT family protein n=1 Tax=Frankia sp. AiPa1 TaxID=573492 RepID=UPI00202B95D3|nr:YggT family protein [Frankia sp. AiPa1]MCL9757951.1 YggT family protein [Frankia sp. AiPa1]
MLLVYLLFLIARWITDLVVVLNRSFRPTGPLLLIFESVYTVTDPPLRFIRRILPPLRVGSVQLDLGYLVLFLVIFVLRSYAQRL